MDDTEGAAGFGFSRERHPESHPSDKKRRFGPPPPRRIASPPIIDDYPPIHTRPIWPWLLIGVLIGAGGTLTVSSLWLQEDRFDQSIAAVPGDAPDSGSAHMRAGASLTEQAGQGGPPSPIGANEVIRPYLVPEKRPADDLPIKVAEAHADDPLNPEPRQAPPKNDQPTGNDQLTENNQLESLVDVAKGRSVQTSAPANDKPRIAADPPIADQPAARGNTAEVIKVSASAPAKPSEAAEPKSAGTNPTPRDDAAQPAVKVAHVDGSANENGDTGPKPSRATKVYHVQLAAVDDERAAESYWREVRQRLPGFFSGIEPVFNRRTVNQRVYFRIWVGAFDTLADAKDYCGQLKTKGQDCFPTRGG